MHNAYFDADCAIQNAHNTMRNAYYDADCAMLDAECTKKEGRKSLPFLCCALKCYLISSPIEVVILSIKVVAPLWGCASAMPKPRALTRRPAATESPDSILRW